MSFLMGPFSIVVVLWR